MKGYAYYNDNDPYVCRWLENLILFRHIPAGIVDSRPIQEVQPSDVKGFTQCHFFAGIGGWAYALRLAGWPDDKAVWTGSCPCQPFSVAGKGKGEKDERHLWPYFRGLIRECVPPVCFGEQVASKAGRKWLHRVASDLEAMEYAVGYVDLCAAGVGAPHIRQRLWWVAESANPRLQIRPGGKRETEKAPVELGRPGGTRGLVQPPRQQTRIPGRTRVEGGANPSGLDNTANSRLTRQRLSGQAETPWDKARLQEFTGRSAFDSSGLAITNLRRRKRSDLSVRPSRQKQTASIEPGRNFWDAFTLIPCLDSKLRRIEPGTFPLAHGVPARMGKLRAYGNAIVPQVAAEFIRAYMEC